MNRIDERMVELLNTTSTLEWLKKKNVELKKAAFDNYFYKLIKKWLFSLGIVAIGALIALPIGLIAGSSSSNAASVDLSFIDNLARTLLAPSITLTGLFVTFTPVISFFFLSELKEEEKESNRETEKLRKNLGYEEEAIAELDIREKYEHVFFHNFRVGILKYIQTYITIGLGFLFFLIITYTLLNPAYFLIIDVLALVVLLTGIFNIISIALYKPGLTLLTIGLKDGKVEIITYD